MADEPQFAELVTSAYGAVKDLNADEAYKLAGFKIVLTSLVGGNRVVEVPASQGGTKPGNMRTNTVNADASDWAGKIAGMLEIEVDQVNELYYLDGETLKLLINRKQLPDSASASTQHIAALLAAGRQAAGLDVEATDFEIIKEALVAHNVFNAKNWTGYIKSLGSKFICAGKGKQQSIRLTNKAYDEAAIIAKQYLEPSE